jgi:diguanylate cyclase (GGDEF)-like protein
LFTLVDKSLIFKKIDLLEELTLQLGIFAIISMLFFYALFFWYLQRKSIRLAALIATPIEKLSDATCDLGGHMASAPLHDVGVEEIDTLKRNFTAMIKALDTKTRQLIELEIREKLKQREAELLETLALTDRLTGLANRHKLDEILEHEFARANRFENQMGVIIMDIDHFKQVNDTYGHQSGDQFLKEIAGILQEHTRRTDTIGRWGGEEFMIICPKTTAQGLFEVAEHLRLAIASYTFSEVGQRTASFGATLSKPSDNIDTIIQRADTALYRAKHLGRNRTETA